ncbi:MAG: glycoside hydrolase family 3 C-terminal domain-containing protein [Bacteroidales bacterium]
MKKFVFLFTLATLILVGHTSCQRKPVYKDSGRSVEERVEDLLGRMTLEEKIALLAGLPDERGMKTASIERLGIPDFKMSDGPIGVRWDESTAFPSGVSLAATWDTSLASAYGRQLAKETLFKGRNMILGPCINMHRLPTGGRNFESYGEDPWLAGRMAVAYVKAVQNEGVIPSVKHFALNNQEWERFKVNVRVDERTLREIYLPHFEMAVKEGGAYTLMASYNKVNDWWASENKHLLKDILKDEWGFKGLVVSDWGATHSTVHAINHGLDLEMPTGEFLNEVKIKEALKKGEISMDAIDKMVRRILWVKFKAGLFDRPADTKYSDPSAESDRVAYEVASRSIVLLKNENQLLPLDKTKIKSLAIIGPNAAIARTGGGGSSHITPRKAESPLEVFSKLAQNSLQINYAEGAKLAASPLHITPSAYLRTPDGQPGLKATYFNNKDLQGNPSLTRIDAKIDFNWEDKAPADELPDDKFSVRWTGSIIPPKTGRIALFTASDDGIRLFVNGKKLIDNWTDHGTSIDSVTLDMVKGKPLDIVLEFYENGGAAVVQLGWDYTEEGTDADRMVAEAVEAARKSDVALVFVGSSDYVESEGYDKVYGMRLPVGQDRLIEEVVKANPRTVVVLYGGTAIDMRSWGARVPAILDAFFPGQEGSQAIADIVFGKVNPSGKLPFTFWASPDQSPAYKGYKDPSLEAPYHEGIFMGYRWVDKKGIQPAFPFGHGLSYTTFSFDEMKVNPLSNKEYEVLVKVTNAGTRSGTEVVQLYVAPPQADDMPVKVLKGFATLTLPPGKSGTARMLLNERSFAYWDTNSHGWKVRPGKYALSVGASSADIRLTQEMELK